MNTVVVLGRLNVILAVAALLLFTLRRVRKYFIKTPSKELNNFIRILSKVHPFIGITLIFTGFLHGYLALGAIRLHTGFIAWSVLLILYATRAWGHATKNKRWIQYHRIAAVLFIIALLVHIFARNII